jgi:hypothetical protein
MEMIKASTPSAENALGEGPSDRIESGAPAGSLESPLTIALLGGLYLAIIMDRYRGPLTSVTMASHGGL